MIVFLFARSDLMAGVCCGGLLRNATSITITPEIAYMYEITYEPLPVKLAKTITSTTITFFGRCSGETNFVWLNKGRQHFVAALPVEYF